MKQIVFALLLFLQMSVHAQTYYDVNNKVIDKETFDKLLSNPVYYRVDNDSLQASRILHKDERGEIGFLENVEEFYHELNEKLNLNLLTDKPLIIYYYPGKDPCNSGGMYISRKEYFASSKKLAKKVKKIADVNVVRVYKNNEGLTTIKDLDWKKDPNALIENLFFNYHYGCESFVIIYKDKYAAVFGEYGHQQVTAALKDLLQK